MRGHGIADGPHVPGRGHVEGRGWIWLFLLAFPWGLIVILVLAATLRRSTFGFVPFTPAHREQVGRRIRAAAWVAVTSADAEDTSPVR